MARLRSITTGTAVAASVATAGFGGLAALTYTGTTNSTLGSSDTTVPGAVGGTTTTTNNNSTNTVTSPVGLQPTAAPVTSTRKKHVTSGGSGG